MQAHETLPTTTLPTPAAKSPRPAPHRGAAALGRRTEAMLRELALVLHWTETVKQSMTAAAAR